MVGDTTRFRDVEGDLVRIGLPVRGLILGRGGEEESGRWPELKAADFEEI